LTYRITQCYLPPDTSEHTPPYPSLTAMELSLDIQDHTVLPATWHKWTYPTLPQPHRLVLDSPTPEARKAELTWVADYIPRWLTCQRSVTHPGSNRARCRAIALIETNMLTTALRCYP